MNPAAAKLYTPLDLTRSFLLLFLPFCALLGLTAAIHFHAFHATERAKLQEGQRLNVGLARHMIASDIGAVVTDLQFLAGRLEQERPWQWNEGRGGVEALFTLFSRQKRLYDQIRMLDARGREVVRVNFHGGEPRPVAVEALQDKSDRYYFAETLQLERGQVYISPLDLNVERGEVERPIKPMMRFGAPLFDDNGERRGIVLLNYYGARLIHNFTRAAANIADHIQLVNENGYWLRSPRAEDEWGFMFNRPLTFPSRHPWAWRRILGKERGQFQNPEGLFTFTTLSPLPVARLATEADFDAEAVPAGREPGDYYWKIVSRVSPDALAATPARFLHGHLPLYGSMLALLALVSFLAARARCRHRWAEAQGEYERRFRHTLEEIDLVAVTVDRAGYVTFCNDHFLELTGWHRDEALGERWVERFIPEEQWAAVGERLAGIERGVAPPRRYDNEVLTRDGERRLIRWNTTLSFGGDGAVVGVTAIGEDITERRRAERQVRKLSRAIEESPSIVQITDREGLIEYVNPKFTKVTGYTLEEVVGKNPRLLKSGETGPDEYRTLWETVLAGGEWRGEFHNKRKNGELYWESAAISALRNPEGEITNFLAVKEDITERKRLESELAHNQTLAAMGRMASMVAHDLRNPLSSVKMALQILAKQARDEQQEELGRIGLDQIRYMEEIMTDMLAYSRPDEIKVEWLAMDKLLEGTVAALRKRLTEEGVALTLECPAGLPSLPGDPNKLRQLFSNLVVNAAQASEGREGERRVVIAAGIELNEAGTAVRVTIDDNGVGFDPAVHDQLFEPFHTTRAKGTGLGLAIVRQIVDRHRGEVWLEPIDGDGTRAVVLLPTAPAESS